MATKIRLQRGGAKKKPFYRFVVADSRAPRDGKFIERIGTYNPLIEDNSKRTNIKKERVEYWLSHGAVPTEKVAIIINSLGIANDNPTIKKILSKRDKTIELKKAEIEAKKKAEEEAKKLEEEKAKQEAAEAEQANQEESESSEEANPEEK